MILSDDLRRVLPIRAKQAETQHLFESFRPGGKELITHGCPFRCMIEPAEREPRPRRTHALWSPALVYPAPLSVTRGSGKLGTVFRDRKHGCAASRKRAQYSGFIRGSAAPGSVGAGFAFAGCSVVPSMRRVPTPGAGGFCGGDGGDTRPERLHSVPAR
jgi:hypothetical protein